MTTATQLAAWVWGTGRRKTAVCRVRLRPGAGLFTVNEQPVDKYFSLEQHRLTVRRPLQLTRSTERFDVYVNACGGGIKGQAEATALGLARALIRVDAAWEKMLRDEGLLTRDARAVERKKYGHKKARKEFQFSKR
jgi:small subunit ribosomal protein S9